MTTALRDAIDYTALGWIKPELDETLRQARMEIEAFADDPSDSSRMRFCASYLHQVQGTLRMVELYAPAMVAEEMEQLAQALQAGQARERDEACATLMRGVVLLPDYLERLQGGHKDIPIVLLPLLNELRAARGEPGLSESVLFAPDLHRPLPTAALTAASDDSRQVREATATPLLAQLQDALSAWPENGAPASAAAIAAAIDGLLAQAVEEADRRMLWVASSVAGALRDGALPPTPALRQAFASVEREARHLFENNGFGLPRADAALEPTRQLLYHVAHADGEHVALQDLRDTFDLSGQGPSESELAHARGSLSGHNRALLDTVSAAIKEDMLRIKDALDLHLRSGQSDVSGLQPQVEALGRVADTLGMLGLGVARNVVQQQREALRAIVVGDRGGDEGALLDIAGALLYVDASLDEQVARIGGPDEGADDDALASESRKVLDVLVREAIANFADARQAFVAFVETNWDHAELAEVPRLLLEVSGALQMLELPLPANYLSGIRLYSERELIARHRVPNGRQLDTLADALASIEYYLEALREQRPNRDDILDIARNSLETLGYWPLPALEPTPVPAPAQTRIAQAGTAVEAAADLAPVDETAALQLPEITPPLAVEPTPAASLQPPAPVGTGSVGGFEVTGDEIDDEIREVFLEEFEEEIGNLDQWLPPWRAAPAELERLRPIRRVFHTLKGSGRLVGARTLGEFAWKVENMLNRVLDNTRPASPAVVAMVDQAFYTLPQLHAALRGEGGISTDLEGMQALADRVAAGEEAFYTAPHSVPAVDEAAIAEEVSGIFAEEPLVEAATATVEPVDDGIPARVDPLLLEILDAEVGGHLATVDRWIAGARATPTLVDDALLRAIHTMNGAFAMTEVPSITDAMTPAEAYVKRLLAARIEATSDGVDALAQLADAARATVAALQTPAPRVPRCSALAARLTTLRDSLPDARLPVDETAFPASPFEQASKPDALAEELAAFDLTAYGDLAESLTDATPVEVAPSLTDDNAEAERLEAGRVEAARIEEEERVEYERLEVEYAEQDRLAREQKLRAEQAEAERAEAERIETERVEAERIEAGRIEAERIEAERIEAERIEAERVEAERVEAERVEAERIEAERVEAEHLEAARIEEEERVEYERLEVEYAEQDRLAREQKLRAEQAEAERIETERAEAERAQTERVEAERAEAPAAMSPVVEQLLAQARASAEDPDEALDLTGMDAELVDIFVEESVDLLDHSDGLLAQLRQHPGEREPLVGLQRDLHTLKGGARMAGIMAVGELGHVMESLLEAVVEQRSELGRDGVPLLERGFDRLHAMVTRVGARRAVGLPSQLIAEFEARVRGETIVARERRGLAAPVPAPRVDRKPADLKPLSAPISESRAGDEDDISVRAPQEQVRIRADLLDRLVNYAGEVAIYRARLEQQLGAFRSAVVEMEQTNARLRDQLRRLDSETEAQIIARYQRENENADETFDPLELDRFSTLQQLSRALAESAADLTSLQGSMDDLTSQYETLLLQQSRVSSDLQQGLMRTRMVPFDALVPRLRRVLRQAATDTGKQVQLKLDGAQGELDRNVLERMTAPLEHMLRNAVAHGLETPEQRLKANKPEEGTVRITVRREGSEVVLEVGDDGAGLNRKAIHKRAVERGLLREDARLADSALDALIMEPGFSTADEVSRVAGRGVGMDVVASEVRQLGGTLDIASHAGEGTTFTLRLPQTLAVTQAVFVRIGDTSFAVPIASVRGVARIDRSDLEKPDASYRYGGEDYALHDLGLLLGHAPAKAEGQLQMPLLLIRAGDLRAAVSIDQVIGSREIVVKPVGPQVASVPGIFGATIMGDGRVVVILDVAPLVRRQATLPRDFAPAPVVEARKVPLVMVVDDSVTMRKVTGRVLERHNFEVGTAKDGIDALERMVDRVPDLMLLDIEMPRMDGYELATQMKADPRLRDVPIIMITSRTGEKHRQRAFEIGVQRYLGKPYQEHELLRNVFELLAQEQADREPADQEPADNELADNELADNG
ncbi:MAG TPA: Hpt domain-containing protein [Luteimonas sp.]|nr:Hpt domain-containing protein [Luteimonas sp.]